MSDKSISLSMSGGGVRAMVFHAGALKYLAEAGRLGDVKDLSTVSGGSLLAALVLDKSDLVWPDSDQYLDSIYPDIETKLTTTNLQTQLVIDIVCKPWNWFYLFSRANVLAKSISKVWGINSQLGGIDPNFNWSINCTSGETGRRFRFKNNRGGDGSIGYFDSSSFEISDAVAISAAYPLIGSYSLNTKRFKWSRPESWSSAESKDVSIKPDYDSLHLMDGGIYDNLGTEPLFNHGTQKPRVENHQLFVIDAGAPLSMNPKRLYLTLSSLVRVIHIATNQARALRIRSLVDYFLKGGAGGVIMIGTIPSRMLKDESTSTQIWQSSEQIEFVKSYPTDLKRVSKSDFKNISEHGYQLMKALFISQEDDKNKI